MSRFIFFFFSSRRRHTRYIGDWSSDVCSSDLVARRRRAKRRNRKRSLPRMPPEPIFTECPSLSRSEERRVGKECRSRWSQEDERKKDIIRGTETDIDDTWVTIRYGVTDDGSES